MAAARAVPDAATIVVERVRDELGDWRVCVLSPRGGRIHAPWAMAAAAKIREETGIDVETLWGDDGFVVRFPDVDQPPGSAAAAARSRRSRRRSSSGSSARRRSSPRSSARTPRARCCCRSAARACARRCGSSASAPPICSPSRRATDRFRCCSKPIASACATSSTCRRSSRRSPTSAAGRSASSRSTPSKPSPFAASLLFSYVASFLYDGDAPLAERRAQALAVDQAQLRELLGDAELRELLDADAIDADRAPAAAARPRSTGPRAPTACTTCCCRSAISAHDEIAARAAISRCGRERRRARQRRGAR